MNTAETDQKLKEAFSHAVPDVLNLVLSDCQKQKGSDMKMKDSGKKSLRIRQLAGIAAAFVLLIGGTAGFQFYQANYKVASTVSLDVNPSIEIMVNKKERVIEVNAKNQDAQAVIGDMDFEGSSLDVTLNALIGSMLRNGYLNEIANSILISVDNQDPVKSAELQTRLADEINSLLQSNSFNGAVLSQSISTDTHLKELADSYGITLGKTQLIQQIIAQNAFYSFEDLVPLSINELNLLSESANLNLNNVNSLGTASDKAYIGEESAWNIALTHAGAEESDLTKQRIELDYENGLMIYELEFNCLGFEYDYEIDAVSGMILKQEKDQDDDYIPANAENAPAAETQDPAAGTGQQPAQTQQDPPAQTQDPPAQTEQPPAQTQDLPSSTQQPSYGGWHHNEHNGHHRNLHHSASYCNCIGESAARGIAFTHACISEGSVYDYKWELDEDDGLWFYEMEFKCDGYEYDYEIDAATGSIVKSEKDYDD